MKENEDTTERTVTPDDENEEQLVAPEFAVYRRLKKSNHNKIIFGVCGGLGEYLSIDPLFFRLLFLLSIIIGGWGIIAYLITGLIMPGNKELTQIDEPALEKIRSANNISVIAGIILLAGLYVLLDEFGYFEFLSLLGIPSQHITTLLLCVILFFVFSIGKAKESEIPPKERFLRKQENVLFGGVCGGLAEYLNISPTALRLAAVMLSVLTFGIPVLIYLLFMAMIPKEDKLEL
jgi:phage shock protein PspC (stress-responsive transcriptional regulator)